MLGNAADAEDILQEALIRWQKADLNQIRSPRAFLVTMVTRLCLKHLDLARVQNELLLGTESALENLPSGQIGPASDSDLADALDAAFSIVLQCLSPIERAVFLLREVFDRDYSEVARIVEKTEDNCRQILRRARERIAGQEPRFTISLTQQETLLQEFLAASTTGDVDRLAAILSEDVLLVRDGDNLGVPAPAPIQGAIGVAKLVTQKLSNSNQVGSIVKRARFQDAPLLLLYTHNQIQMALALVVAGNTVQTLYLITCPVRLRSLAAQCASAS